MSQLVLIRQKGWRLRLVAALQQLERVPHEWGGNDCWLGLAGSVVEAITGTDIAAPYRGLYSSREGALNALRNLGFATLDELVADLLPDVPLGDARIGDLAFVPDDLEFGGFLGTFTGERITVLGLGGSATLPRTLATRAFMVGE